MTATGNVDQQVAAEIARRAAHRLEVLADEAPDLLADRLHRWQTGELPDLLSLTRLPAPLADRDPPRQHYGVRGMDCCTETLVADHPAAGRASSRVLAYVHAEISDLDDEDLLAARRVIAETLPGYMLG
jgi:hypothetical protein